MMKLFYIFSFLCLAIAVKAQYFSGQIYLRDKSSVYIHRIYVTNLSTHRTVLSDYNGGFRITAKEGDIIRFSSLITERKDLKLTEKHLQNTTNFVELSPEYTEIQEVVIKFKPTGILKKDVLTLKDRKKKMELAEMIGLPEPKGDGYSPELPVISGLSVGIESLYDVISGDRERKRRLKDFEITNKGIYAIKNYFGVEYFTKMGIPEKMIDDFLMFVYKSDNIKMYIDVNNIERTKEYIEKYLPIYLMRLKNSSHIKP